MKLRRLAAATTACGLAAAITVNLVWVLVADGGSALEASTQLLGLLAALTGIVAERLAAERHRRRQAMAALAGELTKNRTILGDLLFTLGKAGEGRRRVYPRLLLSATDGIIASGVLAGDDRETFARLHDWRNEVADFNRRLDLTEVLMFLQGTPDTVGEFERALSRDNGRAYRLSRMLQEFIEYLDRHHGRDLRRRGATKPEPVPPPARPLPAAAIAHPRHEDPRHEDHAARPVSAVSAVR